MMTIMGRELKRVKLDFNWELGKVWCGFINPHDIHECGECNGMGNSEEYDKLNDKWFSFEDPHYKENPYNSKFRYNSVSWSNNVDDDDVKALIDADRLWDFTRIPINEEQKQIVKEKIKSGENSWLPFDNGYKPTAKEVNEWNLKGMGHDAINRMIIISAKLKKLGLPATCSKCKGDCVDWQSEIAKELHDTWESYEPPTGEGYQLWGNTSEGSPMTPVFKTLELLCQYCEDEKISVFADDVITKEEWFDMLSEDTVIYKKDGLAFI